MDLIQKGQKHRSDFRDQISKSYKNPAELSQAISQEQVEIVLNDNLKKGVIDKDQIEKAYADFDKIYKGGKYADTEYNKSMDRVGKSVGEEEEEEEGEEEGKKEEESEEEDN